MYEPSSRDGRDPRKLPGNPLVRLTWFKIRAHHWSRGMLKHAVALGVMVPSGYWQLDNKIRLPKMKGQYKRKWFRGFKVSFSSDDESSSEATEIEGDDSPDELKVAESFSKLSLQDMPLLLPCEASHVFPFRLQRAVGTMELD